MGGTDCIYFRATCLDFRLSLFKSLHFDSWMIYSVNSYTRVLFIIINIGVSIIFLIFIANWYKIFIICKSGVAAFFNSLLLVRGLNHLAEIMVFSFVRDSYNFIITFGTCMILVLIVAVYLWLFPFLFIKMLINVLLPSYGGNLVSPHCGRIILLFNLWWNIIHWCVLPSINGYLFAVNNPTVSFYLLIVLWVE
jgi:hypothetical protein